MVAWAISQLTPIEAAPAAIEQLGFLLRDEYEQVSNLVRELTANDGVEPRETWQYLLLLWLYENMSTFSDPFQIVEMIYADFEYPESMEGFIRFLPPPQGEPTGLEAIELRWLTHLQKEG